MREIAGVKIPDYDFSGKVAIVTGGSSGIGRAAAIQLAAGGAKVVIASLPLADCLQVQEEITQAGGTALGLEVDVSKPDQVKELVQRTVAEYGHLDILIANAGIGGQVLPLIEQTADDLQRVLDVNLKGVFNCTTEAARQMIAQGKGGRIICTSSIAYIEGGGFHGTYGAAKAAISTMVRSLAYELAPHQITVNAVAPGMTLTNISKGLLDDPEMLASMLKKIPLARMAMPAEIASLMVYLASEAASFITGTTMIADGGATVGGV